MPNESGMLFQTFDSAQAGGFVKFDEKIPEHIASNLRDRITLRSYQDEALNRYLYYMDFYPNKESVNINLFFNMATGSGKTLIMAALILDLYKRGYNKFVFFVDKDNIVKKTIENFTNPASSKYLFANSLNIDGKKPKIIISNTLNEKDNNNIYIAFMTLSKLHGDILTPRENRVTLQDLTEEKIVLISDEAHHVNAWSGDTSLNKEELEAKNTWQYSVERIFKQNPDNILLEFTATIDIGNPGIARKYQNALIYKYDLKQFSKDLYSKDILVYMVDDNLKQRMLQAVLVSQYRRKVAEKNRLYLKPVILFKSKRIAESKQNKDDFEELIKSLSVAELDKALHSGSEALSKLADYLVTNNVAKVHFIEEIRIDFSESRVVEINSKEESEVAQLELNRLEDKNSEIRAIFAVDKLNEGWDVLNLFDIVRLYDTRDGSYVRGGEYHPGKTTISEAQLIGRGARYWPFPSHSDDRRKYDEDLNNELRILEVLYYHSKRDTDYLIEIREALRQQGLVELGERKTVSLKLKEPFMQSPIYTSGVVYSNELISNPNLDKKSIADYVGEDINPTLELFSHRASGVGGFDEEIKPMSQDNAQKTMKLKELGLNVVAKALSRKYDFYNFANIKKYFPKVNSISSFMEQILYEQKITVKSISSQLDNLSQENKLYIAEHFLDVLRATLLQNSESRVGSSVFMPHPINEVFHPEKLMLIDGAVGEVGLSQSHPQNTYYLDLAAKEWYAHTDNYGTSEEKELVRYVDSKVSELKKEWDNVYLIRNEQDIAIYSFVNGSRFMPDFLLLLSNKNTQKQELRQIFIEPKGAYIEAGELWKEDFLQQLSREATVEVNLLKDYKVHILGLPFYKSQKQNEFDEEFNKAAL